MSFPTVDVTGDAVPPDLRVAVEVEVTDQSSESAPAHFRISSTNEAPAAREFPFGIVAPFGALFSEVDGGRRLHLVPDDDSDPGAGFYDDAIPDAAVDGCWRLAKRFDHIDRGILWPAGPGGTTSLTHAVLVGPGIDGWPSPGEDRFEGEWGERLTDDEEAWEKWGFALVVRR